MNTIFETNFKPKDAIGLSEVGPGVRELSFAGLLYEGKMINIGTKHDLLQSNDLITVDWYLDGDDVEITAIRNNTTGEVYREYNDLPENRGWTEGDELVVCSLLMYGDLN
tara:strand:- start:1502 stop:1831 length:330 start_codon:yes stop_codon:yes gene_type:complete